MTLGKLKTTILYLDHLLTDAEEKGLNLPKVQNIRDSLDTAEAWAAAGEDNIAQALEAFNRAAEYFVSGLDALMNTSKPKFKELSFFGMSKQNDEYLSIEKVDFYREQFERVNALKKGLKDELDKPEQDVEVDKIENQEERDFIRLH